MEYTTFSIGLSDTSLKKGKCEDLLNECRQNQLNFTTDDRYSSLRFEEPLINFRSNKYKYQVFRNSTLIQRIKITDISFEKDFF
jgi:hypothetical protein